jgi:hypothetical protein
MSSSDFDTRMTQVEGRLNEAQGLLDSISSVVHRIEQAHDSAEGRSLVPLVVLATSAIVAVTVVVFARRHQSV